MALSNNENVECILVVRKGTYIYDIEYRVLSIYEGTSEIQRLVIARHLLEEY